MSIARRLSTLAAGLLAGLVAAVVMILLMTAARIWLGISPPPEAVPDRLAPTLTISQFFGLFGRFGGYNGLKKFGVGSGLAALFAVGAVVGVLYALLVESRRSRALVWRRGVSPLGARVIGGLVAVFWLGSLALLWPVLDANFRGVPPTPARLVSIVALLLDYLVFALVLIGVYRFVVPPLPAAEAAPVATTPESPRPVGRPLARRGVVAAGVGVLAAAPAVALLRRLYDLAAFSYDGTVYSGPGVQPITPNDKFYTVTKNVVDPDPTTAVWGLQIDGLVDHPRTLSFADLTALPATDQETTLMCISNNIGAGLSSNAVWTGVPMRDLLNAAGVREGAVEVLLSAADGYTDTFAIEKALDPTTMVVYRMNGEPLPPHHGYPARVIVPGLFGEKNVKWVTGLTVIDHDGKGFYETQGWGPDFEIPTRSDIFSPKRTRHNGQDSFDQPLTVDKPVLLKGRAFAGARGVSRVEISLDGGKSWREATIDYPGTDLTWVFWSYRWTPLTTGVYRLICRATDGDGQQQSTKTRGIAPEGATGLHSVLANVVSA